MAGGNAKYGVELENRFSRPAQGVVKSVEEMRRSAIHAGSAMKAMANDMAAATRAARTSNSAMKRFGTGTNTSTSSFAKNKGMLTDWRTQAVFAKKGASGLTASLDKLGQSSGIAGQGFGGLSAKSLAAKGAIGILIAVSLKAAQVLARLGVQFGMAVAGAVDFLQRSRLAFSLLVKGAGKGETALRDIINLSADLGLPIKETTKQYQKLLAMQFTPSAATDIIKMSADLKALGADTEEVGRVVMAMTQIKSKGRVQSEELLQLAESGVSTELVLQALGKRLGKTTDEVQKLMAAGKITADAGLAAIGEAIKKKAHITEFGEAAKKASGTLSGMTDRLKGGLLKALFAIADNALPTIEKVAKPIFDDLMSVLSSPMGTQIFDTLAGGVKFFVGLVQRAWPMVKALGAGLAQGFSVVLPAIEWLGRSMLKLFDTKNTGGLVIIFSIIGHVVGFAAGYVALFITALLKLVSVAVMVYSVVTSAASAVWGFAVMVYRAVPGAASAVWGFAVMVYRAVTSAASAVWGFGVTVYSAVTSAASAVWGFGVSLIGALDAATGGVLSKAWDLGGALISGLVDGIKTGAIAVITAVINTAGNAIAAAKKILGIGSPSKVFKKLGVQTAQGFSLGVEQGNAAPQAAMTSMAAPPPAAGSLAGGGSTNVGGISISVDTAGAYGAAATSNDPQAFRQAVVAGIRDDVAEELRDILAQLGIA